MSELYYEQFRNICSKYYDFDDENFKRFKDITFIKDVKKVRFYLIIIQKQNIFTSFVRVFTNLLFG